MNGAHESFKQQYFLTFNLRFFKTDMAVNSDYGKPINIVELQEDRSLKLNTKGLEQVLLRNEIKDLPLVVVSIVGDFRKGISFN